MADLPRDDLMGLVQALKTNIFRNLNVADLAVIKSINTGDTYNTYNCKMLNDNNINIVAYALSGLSLQADDLVLVLFTNHDFRNNFNRLKNNMSTYNNSDNEVLHTINNGIIIGKL